MLGVIEGRDADIVAEVLSLAGLRTFIPFPLLVPDEPRFDATLENVASDC